VCARVTDPEKRLDGFVFPERVSDCRAPSPDELDHASLVHQSEFSHVGRVAVRRRHVRMISDAVKRLTADSEHCKANKDLDLFGRTPVDTSNQQKRSFIRSLFRIHCMFYIYKLIQGP